MAVWGCGTFIAMLNIGITLKGFHQYTLRTKYWKYFELEFLFSVNCINGFFGFGFVLGLVFHLIFGEIFSALWNQDCFYCSPEDICVLKPPASPPAASLETTVWNGGWKEGAEAVSWMLLEIPDCMNKLFKRQFSRKVHCSKRWERHRGATRAKRGLDFPTDSPFVWSKSTFSIYRCPSTLTLMFLIPPVQTLPAPTPCKRGLCLMTSLEELRFVPVSLGGKCVPLA